MSDNGSFSIVAGESDEGQRLDVFIASHLTDCSRSYAAQLIASAAININGHPKKPSYRLHHGDQIGGRIPPAEPVAFKAEPIDLDVLFEDAHIVVVNKPPGLVVHPAPGHYSGTLVNALLYHCPQLEGIGGELRPGIVHRLDKDTSGTLVVAKNAAAHAHLSRQFKTRRIRKEYLALVYGVMPSRQGTVTLSVGRHPVDRKRMSTTSPKGRPAETRWRVLQQFAGVCLLRLDLKTGRTHQIRVHCAAIHHPVVGDAVYRPRKLKAALLQESPLSAATAALVRQAPRQMLHAWRLGFDHPATGQPLVFESPVAPDMAELIKKLGGSVPRSFEPQGRPC